MVPTGRRTGPHPNLLLILHDMGQTWLLVWEVCVLHPLTELGFLPSSATSTGTATAASPSTAAEVSRPAPSPAPLVASPGNSDSGARAAGPEATFWPHGAE
jgi:hypothetical protein